MLSQGLSDLYIGLETDLIHNIAAYLASGSINSTTAQWKIQMLARLGALDKQNLMTISEYAGYAPGIQSEALTAAAATAIAEMEPGFQKLVQDGYISATAVPVESTMARALKTYNRQAVNSLNMVNTVMAYKAKTAAQKVINDTAELAQKQEFLNMLNKAAGKVVTGAESRQAAMRQCIKEMTDKGIPAFVDKRGREWSPEAYINMDLRTTMSNVAHQAQFDRMDDYGINLVEVSSHIGARPKCARDQGKIFNRKGGGGYTTDLYGKKIRYYAWKDSSYGEPDGILGINCHHNAYPFTPGVDYQTYFPYDEEENSKAYQLSQRQRELERRVRKSKRECMMYEKLGDKEGFDKASALLKKREDALKKFCADNGLSYKSDRTAVVGYNRALSGKVKAANRRKVVDKSVESSIIETRGDSVAELHKLGHLDTQPLEIEFRKLKTDEIIITNERIAHIKERHPEDYALFEKHGKSAVEHPDLIIKDSAHENTVFMVKRLEETNLNVVVKLILENDEKDYKNSVMTFYRIRDKNLEKLKKKNKTIYKKE